jgi:hypothetical protein
MAAVPAMLPADRTVRMKALNVIREVLSAASEIAGESAERLKRVEALFEIGAVDAPREPAAVSEPSPPAQLGNGAGAAAPPAAHQPAEAAT